MTVPRFALVCAALVAAAPLAAQQTPPPDYSPTTTVSTGVDRIDRMTVPVTVDGKGPYPFVVDTGADRTVLSRELADHLDLKPGESATMHTMTGVGEVRTVRVPTLEVGGGRNDDFNAPALAEAHLGAKGLLGIDSLQGRRVVMDFRKGTFTVSESKAVRERVEPDMIVVTAKSRYGQLILVDSDVGGVPITVIIDSGAQNSVGNLALRQMLAKRKKVRNFVPMTMTDVTGTSIAAELASVDGIRIGGFTINDVAVAFVDAHPFKKFGLLNRPAMLLGMDTLRAFRRVSVDFAQRKVRFLLPDGSSNDTRKQWFAFRSPDRNSPL
ncbi:retroviral-like aspartic protease family protein [Sphingomonas sp. SUN039]|uniref:retroviral-like aspartic protease family protein n=1 Tax=Sphingomonas sp. SUN039 TaxID=2937787 RepID=UPI0021643BE9|nr:retroviral-like aspartic protease family protein [Sphingomonas sp. SUN039]UVO54699.1 retroviral-like aspartic protease family protein [Sphingomonas sp. SUN039]